MNYLRSLLLLVIAICAALSASAQAPATAIPPAAPREVAVKAGRVLDVRTGHYAENQIIWIEGDRIKEIGAASELAAKLPKSARIIDLSKDTVLPGLIECHTHLTFNPESQGLAGIHISVPREALIGAKNARITLEAGFTTVRNAGANGYSDIALRDAINAGDLTGPRILASGPPLSITGGHGDENFPGPQYHVTGTASPTA